MWNALLATATLLAAPQGHETPTPIVVSAPAVQNDKAVRVLKSWIAAYRKGKIDIGAILKNIAKKSLAKKGGVLPKDAFPKPRGSLRAGQFSYDEELDKVLAPEAAKANSKAAAAVLLELASIGLDSSTKYKSTMVPHYVRFVGEREIAKISSNDGRKYIEEAAKGNVSASKKLKPALQAAALMALAKLKDASYETIIAGQLSAADALVRARAAEAIGIVGSAKSLAAVVDAFEKESLEMPRFSQLDSVLNMNQRARGALDQKLVARLRKQALSLLGKGSWRQDSKLISFIRLARNAESIPVVIEYLARYEDPEAVKTMSWVVRRSAWEFLREATGKKYAIDSIQQWRDFWKKEGEGFKAPQSQEIPQPENAGAEGLFGRRLRGKNVLFILDAARQMGTSYQLTSHKFGDIGKPDKKGNHRTLDIVKAQILQSIAALPKGAKVNIVAAGTDTVRSWQKKGGMVAAAKARKGAIGFLKKLNPAPYPRDSRANLWDALELGLGIKTYHYGQTFGANFDEVVIISSCAPSHESGAMRLHDHTLITMSELNRFSQVRINTIFVGPRSDESDKNEIGRKFMEQLAIIGNTKTLRPLGG